MLKNLGIFFLILITHYLKSQITENAILGKWMADDKSVMVEIYKLGTEFHAKVLWFDERLGSGPPMNERRDVKNPNPALRNRKLIGMEVLSGLKYNPRNKCWEHGKIYEGVYGRTWDSMAFFNEKGMLKVRGYWKFEWIGKSIAFHKVN